MYVLRLLFSCPFLKKRKEKKETPQPSTPDVHEPCHSLPDDDVVSLIFLNLLHYACCCQIFEKQYNNLCQILKPNIVLRRQLAYVFLPLGGFLRKLKINKIEIKIEQSH